MLFLWWFGNDLEQIYGPREFLAFYLVSALLGGVAFLGQNLIFGQDFKCLGASGAVTAVLVLCAFHFPKRIILLFLILPVPIWFFAIFNVAHDAWQWLTDPNPKTAVIVHLAGAAFATLYYQRSWRILNLWAELRAWKKRRSRPQLRIYREEVEEVKSKPMSPELDLDEHFEAKVDAVLEKVSRFGQGSLTETERQILLRASEVYRRRRT
jgi:hypothetical protein